MNAHLVRARLPLNRPEYVAVPEAFLTALAQRHFEVPSLVVEDGKPTGLIFQGSLPNSRRVTFRATRPAQDGASELELALHARGLHTEAAASEFSAAVLNSILGIEVPRSDIRPSSPLTPSMAMLQNVRGLLRKENPADIGEILETMFWFGASQDGESTATDRWLQAAQHRLEIDPLLRSLDLAIDEALLHGKSVIPRAPIDRGEALRGTFPDTPFEWFATAWNRLTEPEWVEALPARVWVDWATTVLRLGFGFGFLWESAWYVAVAREVQRDGNSNRAKLQSEIDEIVPWVSSRAGMAARDVAPRLIRRVNQAERIRHVLDGWSGSSSTDSLELELQNMREDRAFRESLLEALNGSRKVNSGSNLWEAIKYALVTRDTSGKNPDYYGVFRPNGRYLPVAPGTEWIAVVASLACKRPGRSTNLGQVVASLATLGMRPELADLVALLERAGMARGSADADLGVIVESAF